MTDNTKKIMDTQVMNIDGSDYLTVAGRVELAHEDGALEGVETEIVSHEPVVVKATIRIKGSVYTGISSANPNKMIERTNPYEVAETSAVGRALGFAGYGLIESIASADEMVKALNEKDQNTPEDKEKLSQEETKYCEVHNIKMLRAISKKTNRPYFWHKRGEDGAICFGEGYRD